MASCCALEAACQADLDCSLCIGDGVCCSEGEMPNCIHEDGNAMSLYECFQAACKTPCASLLE